MMFTLAALGEIQKQREQEEELVAKLALLTIIAAAHQKDICQLVSCCSNLCPCKRKTKQRIQWKHYCEEIVYLTNYGKIWCKKCNIEKPAPMWKLYCENNTADDFNYNANNFQSCVFVCGESISRVPNKEVGLRFLQEFTQEVKKYLNIK